MKIILIQMGEPMFCDVPRRRGMRAMNLAEKLLEDGHNVTTVTSDFDPYTKKHRFREHKSVNLGSNHTIEFLYSPGYKKHISFQRIWDHVILAMQLSKFLRKTTEIPDVVFIGYPPIEVGWVATRWARKMGVPSLLDVKDAWPWSFLFSSLRIPRHLLTLLSVPFVILARRTFASATGICTMSELFLSWLNSIANRNVSKFDFVSPLTASYEYSNELDLNKAEAFWDKLGVSSKDFVMYFVGALNGNYDFKPILSIALKDRRFQLVIAGEGPKRQEYLEFASHAPNIFLPGQIALSEMISLAKISSVSIVPLIDRRDYQLSVPNKFLDAFAFGKPVVTSVQGPLGKMIESNGLGMTYNGQKVETLRQIVESLLQSPLDVFSMSQRVSLYYNSNFIHDDNYSRLASHLVNLKVI